MSDDSDRLFYLGAGPIAAILLGVLLIPARGFTTASNFTFLFQRVGTGPPSTRGCRAAAPRGPAVAAR